ncbi:hypothetical protein P280DRAFT_514571 [Massarina eburnea CBS 473.64]|uniref:Uncharacterized protein n=1 Tax=Massarina eburnea CBS 473.64 TaxID=1395130 RepID=A0A6A6SE48_9PLEO|nr:hypothetical protein P280DRAFT_514571 [Massarina eburnea CBS 473.64]
MNEPPRKKRKTFSPDTNRRASTPLQQPPRRPPFAHTAARPERTSPLKAPPRRPSISPMKSAVDRVPSPLRKAPRRPSVSPMKAAADRAPSPLRKPPRRPSFASPTKSSLSRNYPSLLAHRPAPGASSQNGYSDALTKGKEARAYIMGGKDTRPNADLEQHEDAEQASAGAAQGHDTQNTTPRAQRAGTYKKVVAAGGIVGDHDVDLPMTPSQEEFEEHDTPRRGILFSSPSKKPKRVDDPVKSSSLGQQASSVQNDESEIPIYEPTEIEDASEQPEKTREPPDAELEKKKREKSELMRELKELESQVSQCTQEIKKIQEQSATHVLPPAEREDLIAFINKISKNESDAEAEQAPLVSSLLCSFLPFPARIIPPPRSIQQQQKPVATHRPVELDDPLPYLEMFTDFKITTQPKLPRGKAFPQSNRVHQTHVINITGPQQLLKVSFSIAIDILTDSIIAFEILELSPWAERELGTYMRKKAQEQDVGNASWAIGSYWEIAKKRAEYWHKCEASFSHLILGNKRNARKNAARGTAEKTISRKDFNRHLGRDVLVLEDRHVMLKIRWKIGFDWTGEAESEVGVKVAVPAVWTEADRDNSFKKIPGTFTSLLQSKGAFAATKTMVALLFAE